MTTPEPTPLLVLSALVTARETTAGPTRLAMPPTDRAGRVARCLDDVDHVIAEMEAVAIGHRPVEAGNGDGLIDRADDFAAEPLLQRQVGGDVIGVVVGGEDMGDLPAAPRRRFQNRRLLRRVDRRGKPCLRVVHQNAEIVGAAEKNV